MLISGVLVCICRRLCLVVMLMLDIRSINRMSIRRAVRLIVRLGVLMLIRRLIMLGIGL